MEADYLKYIESVGEAELSELMNRYGDDVWRYAYAITRDREQASDIAQEVFIKAYYSLHTFKGRSTFKTWLLTITRNQAINVRRSSYFRKVLLLESVRRREVAPSAEADYMGRQSTDDIWTIIMQLPRKLREVLVLDLQQDMTMKEIAELLELSEGTVKSRLYRARKEVERQWKEREE
ncbi:RNA polymerase sigma factor [Paenibacillus sp. NPDC058071]|uniref:RNA polymerase sigma factor n=1 Tax=Paenibacillus sp. NPDC058071 TaxID=3346326 RepID=UPI0036DEEA73